MTIPISTDKYLADGAIEKLRTALSQLTWIEDIFPAVKVGKREGGETYPQVYIQSGGSKIIDLIPNSGLKSFVFFEKRNSYQLNDQLSENDNFDLSLIFWGQLPKIDDSIEYDFTDKLIRDIRTILANNNCTNITADLENAFSRYTLFSSQKQMFMYPYTSFKIDFTISTKSCI